MFLLSSLQAVTGAKPEHKIAKLADELEKVLHGHATAICTLSLNSLLYLQVNLSKILKIMFWMVLGFVWFCC